jgi:hypothetical protein
VAVIDYIAIRRPKIEYTNKKVINKETRKAK